MASISREGIDFEIDVAARSARTQSRARERFRNERHFKPTFLGGRNGKAHAVYRDKPFGRDHRCQRCRRLDAHALALALADAIEYSRGCIDVPVDQMSAETLAQTHGVLDVDEVARGTLAERAACQRLRYNVKRDHVAVDRGCGQADAIEGNRVFGLGTLALRPLRSAPSASRRLRAALKRRRPFRDTQLSR